MASYPDAVKSFTTKNQGDVVQSAHVNEIQSEVNAIESGLLNGTAPLTSSRAVVTALTVSGGSTLATLSVSGGSTFAIRPVLGPPPYVKMFVASSYTIGSSALSTLSFLTASIEINSSLASTAILPTAFTPDSTGIWRMTAQITTDTPSSGQRGISVRDSSGAVVGQTFVSNSTKLVLQVCGEKRFDVTGGSFTVVFENPGVSTHSIEPGAAVSWASLLKM
jgi:hypothetical protein